MIEQILHSSASEMIWQGIVASLWQASIAAVLLWVLLRLIAWPRVRYALACVAMVAGIAGPVASVVYRHEAMVQAAQMQFAPLDVAVQRAGPMAQAASVTFKQMLPSITIGIWAIGVILLSLWQIGGWCYLQWLRRQGTIIKHGPLDTLARRMRVRLPRLVESAHVHAPAVAGFLKPVILLPIGILNDLPGRQIEAILAHELAHIRRWDYAVNLLQSVVETLMFYHPAVWWISRVIRIEREICCDEIAAKVCGDRVEYADALLTLENRRSLPLALAANSLLKQRITRIIMEPQKGYVQKTSLLVAMIVICFVSTILVLSSRAHANPPPDHDTLRPGDRFTLVIDDLVGPGVETVKDEKIESDGDISLPIIGKITVADLTVPQTQQAIVAAYKARLSRNVTVTITLVDLHAADDGKKLTTPSDADFPQTVKFQTYNADFAGGDIIEISEIRGTSDTISPGNIYLVKGTYILVSHDKATIAAFITSNDPAGVAPSLKVQSKSIERGRGTFALYMPMAIDGEAHVSFYSRTQSFGGVYFRTPGAKPASRSAGRNVESITPATQPAKADASDSAHYSITLGAKRTEYPLKSGMTLAQALAIAGASDNIGKIWIQHEIAGHPHAYGTRAASSGLALKRGDGRSNIAIEPGDQIDVLSRGLSFLRVIIDGAGPTLYGKATDWESIRKLIDSKSEDDRWDLRLEIAADSDSISAQQMKAAMAQAQSLVEKYNLAGVRNIGLFPNAIRRLLGVCYIGGHVNRVGVYQLHPEHRISVKEAIALAGGLDKNGPAFVQVMRRDGDKIWLALNNCAYGADSNDPRLQRLLEADDQVLVMDRPAPATQTSSKIDHSIGVFHMGGLVERAGVYELTNHGINVTQAVIAVGLPAKRPLYVNLVRHGQTLFDDCVIDAGMKDARLLAAIVPDDEILVLDHQREKSTNYSLGRVFSKRSIARWTRDRFQFA